MLFSLRGRIPRRDWWIGQIGLALLTTIGFAVIYARSYPGLGLEALGEQREPPAAVALDLLMLWPTIALAVKREHDRDGSGWLSLGLVLGSALLGYLPDIAPGLPAWTETASTAAIFGALAWLLVTLGVLDGTPGPNRFGPSPKRFDPADA